MDTLQTAYGSFQLRRQPILKNDPLRAWDAADELLLQFLAKNHNLSAQSSLLILNDAFAAISCNLHHCSVTSYSDSYLSQKAIADNFQINQLQKLPQFVPSTETPQGKFDFVLIKIPKSLALLEHQLSVLQKVVHSDTQLIAAGMVKYLQKSHYQLFERYIGPVSTSLAQKKARLLFAEPQIPTLIQSPYPTSYYEPITGLTLINHANVFSLNSLDIGSRFLLENLQQLPAAKHIIDIGCGNGILGIAARKHLQSQGIAPESVLFADESFMALASAEKNYRHAFSSTDGATFVASDCFDELSENADLVLCNPPFHQHNSVGDHIAWKMIVGAHNTLTTEGILWLIGNRHLGYHNKLKKVFGNCQLIASNKKFVLLSAIKH